MTEMFEWKSDSGRIVRLPRTVKSGLLRKYRKLPELELQYVLLEAVCDEDQLTAIDDLDADEFTAMMTKLSQPSRRRDGSPGRMYMTTRTRR